MDKLSREYHPFWKNNPEGLCLLLTEYSLGGRHLCRCKFSSLYYFENSSPERYEYAAVYAGGKLTEEMLAGRYEKVLDIHDLTDVTVFRRKLPYNAYKEAEFYDAEAGDLIECSYNLDVWFNEVIEQWLSQKSAEGMLFIQEDEKFRFIKLEPQDTEWHVEYLVDGTEFVEYLSEMTDNGWELVWTDGDIVYFRKSDNITEYKEKLNVNSLKLKVYMEKLEEKKLQRNQKLGNLGAGFGLIATGLFFIICNVLFNSYSIETVNVVFFSIIGTIMVKSNMRKNKMCKSEIKELQDRINSLKEDK